MMKSLVCIISLLWGQGTSCLGEEQAVNVDRDREKKHEMVSLCEK